MIKDKKSFYRSLRKLFSDEELIDRMWKKIFEFVHKNVGTTDRIIKEIFSYLISFTYTFHVILSYDVFHAQQS